MSNSASNHIAINQPIRRKIVVTGIVQGVGFRPFVYREAIGCHLSGSVLNDADGVTIELQGAPEDINRFIHCLKTNPPPLARIDKITETTISLQSDDTQFKILETEHVSGKQSGKQAVVAVSADKSTCKDCLAEMADPNNRHFGYAFTNCTNCGPRYTIIKALPYDRHYTAMAGFAMCPDCAKAYQDPLDRRYHAQPVSCPHCGPRLSLTRPDGNVITMQGENDNGLGIIDVAAKRLAQGQILAIKGLGGFHLVCDASNNDAVKLLRHRKRRQAKPLAVMMPSLETAKDYVDGSKAEWQLLSSQERPIVLMAAKEILNPTSSALAADIAPGLDRLGIFLPYTPLHHLLLKCFNGPLVATSANISGEPIITNCDELIDKLKHVVDAIVDHNRPIINGCDDSVVQLIEPNTDMAPAMQVLRLARGYAPLSLPLDKPIQNSVLAVGAQQKNALALGFGCNLFLSPHIGDLFSVSAEGYFERTLNTFISLYGFSPSIIAKDKHPDYAPSRWAQAQAEKALPYKPLRRIEVQHHYAHVLSVMAANRYTGPVLGFSFDGTGLGEDGTLWGGEVLCCDLDKCERIGHFESIALLGGEQAIKQPVRLLLALLFEKMELDEIDLEDIQNLNIRAIQALSPIMLTNLHRIWQSGSAIKTSSVGRLFDALACALGFIDTTQFEGQAGMMIEAAARRADRLGLKPLTLDFPLKAPTLNELGNKARSQVWQSSALFKQVISLVALQREMTQQSEMAQQAWEDLRSRIARAFIHALGDAVCAMANCQVSSLNHIPIVLTGGVFQNRYLLEYCLGKLNKLGHRVLESKQIPINDGGIALGQLWYAIHHTDLSE
ncbi:carbamoyltransferase HypF [Shewanella acanthi]|uniref:carbamoyltransferase HypF n=1 Tax=Shewanella acanthi TaxID=2864212 RepID=UPI001C6597D5|nr:carbamoyltransferase HypF [Shewanella acanthi]QYJ80289.1 carbamoyltransferase HypF [Shewanella acanthi]